MKSNAERAQEKLTLTPQSRFTLEKDGFIGALYRPEREEYRGKAVILFGGTDGNYPLTKLIAEQYANRGMTVLATAYWNCPGLPNHFGKLPLETLEKPARWLRENGFEKVGLWGISKGAELALVAGSVMPELISCVTAVCPISIRCQGLRLKKKVAPLHCSSWSWRGEELPWAELRFSKGEILRDSIRERGVCLRSCYLKSLENAPENARIPVEDIGGPILLLTPEYDGMWPSEIAAKQIMERLNAKGFAYPHQWYRYRYASHFLVPYPLSAAKAFAVERKFPDECWKSNMDSFEKTLAFWKEAW